MSEQDIFQAREQIGDISKMLAHPKMIRAKLRVLRMGLIANREQNLALIKSANIRAEKGDPLGIGAERTRIEGVQVGNQARTISKLVGEVRASPDLQDPKRTALVSKLQGLTDDELLPLMKRLSEQDRRFIKTIIPLVLGGQ